MTNISQYTNGGYYQLPNQKNPEADKSILGNKYINQSLAEILGNEKGAEEAYSLTLGPDAQNYMNSYNNSGSAENFVLNSEQRNKLNEILNKYKDKELTQENYKLLQNELQQAGLSPQQLAIQDKINNFNPSQILIAALNGSDPNQSDGVVTDAESNQKIDNYLNSILENWQKSQPA